ncbi:hypothetical protein FCG67_03770 [Rhodococcus oryzae]|uniref:Uncharacterized protein n=1 Tax=Rhodococcus oryzae TaxID=2571143 RepID=A0ABY2RRL6_9NOCA|nr:hypothetical protein [Rhodococcus oryzae]TJZ80019.1 hypothetical protein FCG67_03770 [Rhodococcus oryzae]
MSELEKHCGGACGESELNPDDLVRGDSSGHMPPEASGPDLDHLTSTLPVLDKQSEYSVIGLTSDNEHHTGWNRLKTRVESR